jgi:hypothetical protein
MRKVGVVCAFNPGNTGMHSVDLAAEIVLRQTGIDFQLINFQRRPWRIFSGYPLCRKFGDLGKFSHILFWGDFQNNPLYGTRDFTRREVKFGYAKTIDEGIENWKHLHLELSERIPRKMVIASIGNCFLGASSALGAHDLREPLRAFTLSSARILPRESWSTKELLSASGASADTVRTGLDAAFLLNLPVSTDFANRRHFGYAFARSGARDVAAALEAIRSRTRLIPVEIPWTVGDRRKSYKKTFERALNIIPNCRFIISDIYHLSINAINHGTPVISISKGVGAMESSVDDQKKYALAEQIGTTGLHVSLPPDGSLLSILPQITARYDLLMEGQISRAAIMDGLHDQKRRFLSAIKEVLDT